MYMYGNIFLSRYTPHIGQATSRTSSRGICFCVSRLLLIYIFFWNSALLLVSQHSPPKSASFTSAPLAHKPAIWAAAFCLHSTLLKQSDALASMLMCNTMPIRSPLPFRWELKNFILKKREFQLRQPKIHNWYKDSKFESLYWSLASDQNICRRAFLFQKRTTTHCPRLEWDWVAIPRFFV